MPARFLLQKSRRRPWLVDRDQSEISRLLEEVDCEDLFALFRIGQIHKEISSKRPFLKNSRNRSTRLAVAMTNTGEVFLHPGKERAEDAARCATIRVR